MVDMMGDYEKLVFLFLGVVFGLLGWGFADNGHNFLAGLCMLMTCFYAIRVSDV